jgi:hypothetical protein
MQVGGFEEFLADGFTRAALKQHIVWHDVRSRPADFEQGVDVLNGVKLLVAARRPKVLTVVNTVFLILLTFFIGECETVVEMLVL